MYETPFEDDGDPVRQRENFREFGGNEKDRRAPVPLLNQSSVHIFNGAYVETSCGLGRNQQARFSGKLSPENQFLLIATRERACLNVDAWSPDVIADEDSFGEISNLPMVETPAAGKWGAAVDLQDGIFRQVLAENQATTMAVLRMCEMPLR